MCFAQFASVSNLARRLHRALVVLLLMTLAFLPAVALAREGMPLSAPPISAARDPIPRIQCPMGYTATTYAEGLSSPDGLAFDPSGMLHVAEETAGRISRIESDGSVTPVLSGLTSPEGITFDDVGNLYVVEDAQEGRLVKMATDGITTTLATGLDAPEGVVWATDGTLYVTESNVQFASIPPDIPRTHVTAIPPAGVATRILTNTLYWSYAGITIGSDGLLYVTNEASGTGTHDSIFTVDPATGARTAFATNLVAPEGLRFAADGGFPLYVVEEDTGGGAGLLVRVEANGSHVPLCAGFYSIEDVVQGEDGRLYISEDGSDSVVVIEADAPNRPPAHAIILFIGDGMGEAHRTAARWSAVGQGGALAMDMMPYVGWSSTASADDPVTDSAAGGTAVATGVKTNNGMIGQDPDGDPLTTILERAQARGMAVGLVTTTQMAHATPASFAAHVPSRYMMTEIASQMVLTTEVDVLLGGGEDEFLPTTATGCYPEAGERADGLNLITEAQAAGYTYVCDAASLTAVDPSSTPRLLGLFADEGMTRPFSPSLADMTQKAIDILSQDPDGFFLMVEGGQIDWASHANDATNTISDTVDFDQAVELGRAYAATTDNVLVIVTADHEAGGMSDRLTPSGSPDEDGPYYMPEGTAFYVNWTSLGHTAADVPVTAQGPWSDLLVGSYENTYIHDVMRLALESSPDITPAKVALPPHGSTVAPGDRITYTITLTNAGTADATGLTLTDTLSADVDYVPGSISVTPGFSIASTSPPDLVVIGDLPASQVLAVTFCVTVTTDLTTTITNTVILVSDQTEPQSSNSVSHQVQPAQETEPRHIYLPVVLKNH